MRALQYQSSRSLLSSAQWPTTCGITMQARVEWLQCLSQPRVNIWTQVLVRPVLGLPVLLHHQWLASHKPEASWYHLICRRWGWHLPIIPNPYSFSMFQRILRNYFGPYIFWYLLSNHWHHPFAKTHIEYWKLWRGILELAEVSPIPRLWVARSFKEAVDSNRLKSLYVRIVSDCVLKQTWCLTTHQECIDSAHPHGSPGRTSQSWRLPKRIRSHHFGMIALTNRFRSISVPSGNLT